MQLPDEAISYQYQTLLVPAEEDWTPRGGAAAPAFFAAGPAARPDAAALAGSQSDRHRTRTASGPARRCSRSTPGSSICRKNARSVSQASADSSVLGRSLEHRQSAAAGRRSLRHSRHRRLLPGRPRPVRSPAEHLSQRSARQGPSGTPRIYFDGNNFDNDALQELLDMLANHLRRSRRARGALGGRRHQQIGRTLWRPPSPIGPCAGKWPSITAPSRRSCAEPDHSDHRPVRESCATSARRTASPTNRFSPSPTTWAAASPCSPPSVCSRPPHGPGRACLPARSGRHDAHASSMSHSNAIRCCNLRPSII